MISFGTPAIHDQPVTTREQRIEAAEDRAEQVAFEVARERSYDESISDFNARMFEIQAEYEAAERADRERYGS